MTHPYRDMDRFYWHYYLNFYETLRWAFKFFKGKKFRDKLIHYLKWIHCSSLLFDHLVICMLPVSVLLDLCVTYIIIFGKPNHVARNRNSFSLRIAAVFSSSSFNAYVFLFLLASFRLE